MKQACLCIAALFLSLCLQAQEPPDLSKLKTIGEKITAWHNYCNQLLGYNGEGSEPYKRLVVAGKKGMTLAPADSIRARAMFALFTGVACEYILQYDSARVYLSHSAALARQIGKSDYEMLALSRLDNIADYTRNTALRKQLMQRMIEIADTSTDLKIKEQAAKALAGYYRSINDYEKTITWRIKDIALYKEGLARGDTSEYSPRNLGFMLSNIAMVFNETGQHKKALEYLEEARPYIGNTALKGIEETFYINLIQSFLGLKNIDSARYYYQLTYQGMAGRDTLYHTLCYANQFFGHFFYDQKMIDSAYHYTLLARQTGMRSASRNAYLQATELMGKIYFQKGDNAAAIRLLSETLHDNDYTFYTQSFADIHKTLALAYAQQKKWDSAYAHYSIYSNLNDSLLTATANKNFADAEARFQNSEKKQQIALQQKALTYARQQKIWLTAGLVLLALIVLLLIIIYRSKKRTADLLNTSNQELNKLNSDLNEANKTKAKLFSIISHDLRSPISQVYQYLKLQQLNPAALSETEKASLSGKIQAATGSLLETMEDLLLWSKTQMSEFKPERQPVDIIDTIRQTCSLLQLAMEEKKLSVSTQLPDQYIIQTDPYYLQTILRNLLQNAIKASPPSSDITITITGHTLSISNRGKMFSQSDYEAALQDNDSNKSLQGLGLKLADELSRKVGLRIYFASGGTDTTTACLQWA